MKPLGLKFDGRVIEELSSKIPSNLFALNELTKNAYDAFAREITIKIDRQSGKIVISDDGKGMTEADIEKLLHIANSSKKYGSKKTYDGMERYIQGSKGLGFLSVFKFGNRVTWATYDNGKKVEFTIEKKDVISKRNASRFKVQPKIYDEFGKGTTISIEMDEEEIKLIDDYFQEEKNAKKIVNSFYDNDVNITLSTSHGEYVTEKHDEAIDKSYEDQFCYVSYDSKSGKIKFYKLGHPEKVIDFSLSSNSYSIEVELMIYHFNPGRSKKNTNISELFYRDSDDALTPLLFINNNLFNNYTMFDSNINRAKRSGESMPQMIGYVKLYCSDNDLQFNSDRTNFVENGLTRRVKSDFLNLNKKIQKVAAEIKSNSKPQDGSKKLETGKAKPLNLNDENVDQVPKPTTAKINLMVGISRRHLVPSKQIDLRDYVGSVVTSLGEKVGVDRVRFESNGEEISPIVAAVREDGIKEYQIIYEDESTGEQIESLKLEFFSPKASISGNSKRELFILTSKKSYSITIPVVARLINQISDVYEANPDHYEIIACSLRTIMELSKDSLKSEYSFIFNHKRPADSQYDDRLLWDIVQIIHFLRSNQKIVTACSQALRVSYHSFNSFLDIDSYKSSVKKSHLGAHRSTEWLTPDDVKSLAHRAGHLAVICDVLITRVDRNTVVAGKLHSYPSNGGD